MAREARVQAQEVGVIKFTKFSQGDTGLGYLMMIINLLGTSLIAKGFVIGKSLILINDVSTLSYKNEIKS